MLMLCIIITLKQINMKKYILASTIIALIITGSFIISCGNSSSSENVEDAQDEVAEANENLNEANEAYMIEMKSYRSDADKKIAANNKSIEEFKARVDQEKKEAKAYYLRKIEELEQKNSDMKKRMDDYKADGKEQWETFKTEFNHDMDEMGNAIRDIGVNNVK